MPAMHFLTRVIRTPLSQLIRGKLGPTPSDFVQQLDGSGLTQPARDLIRSVVKKTRLWHTEKFDVQSELISHFLDGKDAGVSEEKLVERFGDVRTSAKLIRRAKMRNRPAYWHAKKWLIRGTVVLLAVYGVMGIRFFTGKPTVKVDYVAQLNAPILKVPEDQRGWTVYKEVIRTLENERKDRDQRHGLTHNSPSRDYQRASEAEPVLVELVDLYDDDPRRALLPAALEKHRGLIDQISLAATKPEFGFVYGNGGSFDAPDNPWGRTPQAPSPYQGRSKAFNETYSESLLDTVMLPDLNHLFTMASILLADAEWAGRQRDGERLFQRWCDLANLTKQRSTDRFIVVQSVTMNLRRRLVDAVMRQIDEEPDLLSDAQLKVISHRLAGGRVAADVFDLTLERAIFADLLQRMYTDDGNGDGRLTKIGVEVLLVNGGTHDMYSVLPSSTWPMFFAVASRKEAQDLFDELIGTAESELRVPYHELPNPSKSDRRLMEIRDSQWLSFRYQSVLRLTGSFTSLNRRAAEYFARRDAMQIAIACELHKRSTGTYPATLDALVPSYLPTMPIDPVDGKPLRYVLRDGKPVVYSVGADGDDDGGRAMPLNKKMKADDLHRTAVGGDAQLDCDWQLYPKVRDEAELPPSPTTAPDRR
jgi:hypothetical protein